MVASVGDKLIVKTAQGVNIEGEMLLKEIPDAETFDVIVIPGGELHALGLAFAHAATLGLGLKPAVPFISLPASCVTCICAFCRPEGRRELQRLPPPHEDAEGPTRCGPLDCLHLRLPCPRLDAPRTPR